MMGLELIFVFSFMLLCSFRLSIMNTYYLYNQKKNVVEIAINFIKNGDKEENALVIM